MAALKQRSDVSVSIATGGWRASAMLKLQAAGIKVGNIPLVSCDQHISRTDIMQTAAEQSGFYNSSDTHSICYFGDGQWDQTAAARLGYNFILVGNALNHPQQIDHFENWAPILAFTGLPA